MKARTALLELFKESGEWRTFFRSCCETSASRLRSRACWTSLCGMLGGVSRREGTHNLMKRGIRQHRCVVRQG